jgi:hypothetical protein
VKTIPKALGSRRQFSLLIFQILLYLIVAFEVSTARLSVGAPGSIDPSFDPGAGLDISKPLPVRVIFPLADGSFLLGGIFTNYNSTPRIALARILEDGAVDQTFAPPASFIAGNTEVWSISQQTDGKFVISGITGSPFHAMIIRLNNDGSLDPTFTFAPRTAAFGMAVHARSDGLIAYLTDDNTGIGLLNSDGSRLLTSGGGFRPFGLFTRIRTSPEGNTFYCLLPQFRPFLFRRDFRIA